ncbi:MAG: mechanosensitive ion channel family protein [Dehalococcoidia bacterium]|nr:mechanosensitive ion channel family protein [Dehalococcoidia bacterium]
MIDWTPIVAWLITHGTRILIIIAIGVVANLLLRKTLPGTLTRMLSGAMQGHPQVELDKRNVTLSHLFVSVGSIIIFLITAFLLLSELEINIAALLAGFGVAGIAIGFGAQSLVKDLISGLIITMENQYNVGDVIRIADISGMVESVNLRRTTLRDLDGALHIVPNGEIRVTSTFTKVWSRANLNIGVAYKEDVDRVMAVIRKTWEDMAQEPKWGPSFIAKTPGLLRVDELGDSAVVIKVAGETQPLKQWDVMAELRRRIKKEFDAQGIEIPWPHMKVFMGKEE